MNQNLAPGLALIAYPGLLVSMAVGLLAEAAAVRLLVPAGEASRRPIARLREAARGGLVASAGLAALLAALAAAQLAAPFNPVAPAQRNVLVAAIGMAFAFWLARGGAAHAREPAPGPLLLQGSWLLAVLLPAIAPQSLRPQVLGAVALPSLLPLKVATASLYLICLPGFLHLLPDSGGPGAGGSRATRAFLWLPASGLFTSLFFGPSGDDLAGLLRFTSICAGASAAALGVSALMWRWPQASRRYGRLLAAWSVLTLLVFGLTLALR